MSEQNETQHLKEWYVNFLKLFREEFSKLSEQEKVLISKSHNYTPNCQIEVFWLKQLNWQLIVTTHFKDRPDCEITINGPYDSTIFQDEVKKVLNHPRWNKPLYSETKNLPTDSPHLYNEFLAQRLHIFTEGAKNAMFIKFPETNHVMIESIILENGLIEHVFGDMSRCNYEHLIKKMVQDTKEQLEFSKNMASVPQKSSPEIKYSKGFANHLFPPIIIGGTSRRTVNEIFHGINSTSFSLFDKEPFDVMFDDIFVLVEKDGFIGVCTDDMIKALEILNTIMIVFILDGIDTRIVREHELSNIEYDPKTHNVVSRSFSYNSPRNKLFDEIPDKTLEYETRHIDKEHIKKIFEKASKIFANNSLAEDLRIILESTTHMKNSEFLQAFIMSWYIIEKYITQKWKKKFNKDTTFKTSYTPSADMMIKDLKDELQEKYSDFMKLKKIRNDSLHAGKRVTQKEAQKCVDISKELVLKNSTLF